MTAWNYFLVLLGASTVTAQLFHVIDAIERPRPKERENLQ